MKADREVWKAVEQEIASRITDHQFKTWFRSVRFSFSSPESVSVSVPNRFYQTFLSHRFLSVIQESIETVTNLNQPRIEFQVEGDDPREVLAAAPEAPSPRSGNGNGTRSGSAVVPAAEAADPLRDVPANQPLNPGYTFDQFVVGPSNRLAHAAAVAVSENPGSTYNPLFLYGSVGLGKTHLMEAVAHTFLARGQRRFAYLSCATFTNDFIAAVQNHDLDRFRDKYRRADALLIDDIQFLAGKERTQDEFFHTFNAVYGDGKQIFLSSDSLPSDIAGLGDRLASRFRLGLVAQLEPPSLETRIAILMRKAENMELQISDDVAHFVAERITDNIREIQGAVVRMHSLVTIEGRSITVETVRDALSDLFGDESSRIDPLAIQQAVLQEFDVRPADLHSRKRNRSIVVPRQICMYLTRKLTNLSLEQIGQYFGGRDHSTVLHAIEKIEAKLAEDERIRRAVKTITSHLGH